MSHGLTEAEEVESWVVFRQPGPAAWRLELRPLLCRLVLPKAARISGFVAFGHTTLQKQHMSTTVLKLNWTDIELSEFSSLNV